ncbi:MAG: nitroreductase family protein [Clostridium baratii]|uniref:nitroreductase family protein n=1 Tax=Clostridium baratii TaxID=1561 RepID=UPI00242E6881|nr:nitroreductase family protein [Clostridium baratii]MBS6006660.1 nitroreductase family protein [Clostridium baratii]MDU4910289.1 nitroreductase family protein [Clostridium baratii]
MDFYDVIKKRQSISKYKGEDVYKESIMKMIDSAMRAPSWKNKSSFKIIIVEDKKIKENIANSIINDDDKAKLAVLEAPIVVIICAEPYNGYNTDGKSFYLIDGAIAMEHFILAATAEGYGTMWIGSVNEEKIKETLKISDNIKIVGITPLGVPAEIKEHNPKKDIDKYVFLNEYDNPYTDKNK